MRAKTTLEIGLLYRKQVRNFLEECIFNDMDITYHESKGLIDSKFIIRGDSDDVKTVYNSIESWAEE